MAGFLRKYKQNKLLLAGGILALLIIALAIAAPLLTPCDPNGVKLEDRLQIPGGRYLMGTDGFGRDILSRVIYGARFSLTLAATVVAVNFAAGLLIGSVAGYFGGLIDEVIMRIVDVLMAFPNIILVVCVVGVIGATIENLILAMVILGWVGYSRIARGLALSLKEQCFISAAKALGAGSGYIIFRHVIPNIIPPLIVLAALNFGHTILSIAALSFIGLGIQPPTPEWGAMLNEGKQFVFTYPHIMVFPGLAITVTVFAFNLLGDGLRDALDPRLRETVKM